MDEGSFRNWEKLCELIWGCAIGQAIHVAVQRGIPELLNESPKSCPELACATQSDEWQLGTVLRALEAFEILSMSTAEKYALTPMGELLLRSSDHSSAYEAGAFFETIYRPLGALDTAIKTGRVPFDSVYGRSFYEHITADEQLKDSFYDMMFANAGQRYAGLSSVYDFSRVARIVDIGGGEGSLLLQLLRAHPHLTATLLDLPAAVTRAAQQLEAAGVAHRCQLVSGDFREAIPTGGDTYVLAQILNNWPDDAACRILSTCRAAMPPGADLLILEAVREHGVLPRWKALVSLGVMAQRGGCTRSEAQLRSLLSRAGFQVHSFQPLPASVTWVIRAQPLVQ